MRPQCRAQRPRPAVPSRAAPACRAWHSAGRERPVCAALTLNNLAAAPAAAGDYSSACDSLRHAVAIDQATWGPYSPQTAATLKDLGIALTNSGHVEPAAEVVRRSLAIYEAAYGPTSPQVAQTPGVLAETLNQLGMYSLARDYFSAPCRSSSPPTARITPKPPAAGNDQPGQPARP
jgi:hypothetical protein